MTEGSKLMEEASTLGNLIDRAARKWPDNEAMVFKDERITYKEMKARADRMAIGLLKLGVKKGDHVGVCLSNSPRWTYCEFALDKIGATVIPLNTRYKTQELDHVIKQSDCSTVITVDKFLDIHFMDMLNNILPGLKNSRPGEFQSNDYPFLKRIICYSPEAIEYPGTYIFDEIMASGDDKEWESTLIQSLEAVQPTDIAHIPYTSGTTGKPKGSMTTHFQYLKYSTICVETFRIQSGDRFCAVAPFFFNFGFSVGMLYPFWCGGCSIPLETFDPLETMKAIYKEECTYFIGAPTMWVMMLKHPEFPKYNLDSLRVGIIGSAPAPAELIQDMINKTGVKEFYTGYGMTENSVATTLTLPGDSPEIVSTTIGKPIEDVELQIVDVDSGETLSPGKDGEICTRGWLLQKGYYNMPEETAKVIDKDGWFHTGDLGQLTEDNYVKITGRLKDMIITGGINVACEAIENYIYTHPKVEQVAIIGVPDQRMGEVVMACLVLKKGMETSEQEIIDFCKGKIAGYEIPKYVEFMDEFPTTPQLKIKKFKLKEAMIEKRGLKGM